MCIRETIKQWMTQKTKVCSHELTFCPVEVEINKPRVLDRGYSCLSACNSRLLHPRRTEALGNTFHATAFAIHRLEALRCRVPSRLSWIRIDRHLPRWLSVLGVTALQGDWRGAGLALGADGIEQVRSLIDAGAGAVGEAGDDVEAEEGLRLVEAAEALDHALVVVDGGVVGHDGIGGAERHDELAATQRAQDVGVDFPDG